MVTTSIINTITITLMGCTWETGELVQITSSGACARIYRAVLHARRTRVRSTIAAVDLRNKFEFDALVNIF